MKNSNSIPATDTTRIDDLVAKLEARLAEVKRFRETKIAILEESKPRIIAVLKKCGVTVTGIGNLYSTGIGNLYSTGFDDRSYQDDSQMMVTLTAIPLNTPYKQADRLSNKIEKAFEKEFGKAIGLETHVGGALTVTCKGEERTETRFQIRIR